MKHIHEMPLFREYEYTRVSFHAMIAIAAWQEVKIVEFYKSEGAPKLPRAIKEVLRLEKMSLEEFKQDWVCAHEAIYLDFVASLSGKERDFKSILGSVFDLVSHCRGYADPQLGMAAPSTTDDFPLSGEDAQDNSQGGHVKG